MDNQKTRVVLQSGWFNTLEIAYVIECNVFICSVYQYANLLYQLLNKLKQVALCFFSLMQATHVSLLCPMRFNKYPLDKHTCKFMVGSSNYDETRMTFSNYQLQFDPSVANTIVDYEIVLSG